MSNPLLSILSIAVMLGVFLCLEGVLELALYFRLRRFRHSFWVLIDGVGTLILGIVFVSRWPPASEDTIGTLVGISLMLTPVCRGFLSFAVRGLGATPA